MTSCKRIAVTEINPHLLCSLCGGYYVDATTVVECLHTFCKSCIVHYLETSKFCPVCDVQIHKTNPLLGIRSDRILQNVVYKLVPGLYKDEINRRHIYNEHSSREPCSINIRCDLTRPYYLPDEVVTVALMPFLEDGAMQSEVRVRYLQCPGGVRLSQLKRLIRSKFELVHHHPILLLASKDDPLTDDLSLIDVAYIKSWQRNEPLCLYYMIYFNKRMKVDPEFLKYELNYYQIRRKTKRERAAALSLPTSLLENLKDPMMPKLEPECNFVKRTAMECADLTLPRLSPIKDHIKSPDSLKLLNCLDKSDNICSSSFLCEKNNVIKLNELSSSALDVSIIVASINNNVCSLEPLYTSSNAVSPSLIFSCSNGLSSTSVVSSGLGSSKPLSATTTFKAIAPAKPQNEVVDLNMYTISSLDQFNGANYGYGLSMVPFNNSILPTLIPGNILDPNSLSGAVLPFGLNFTPTIIPNSGLTDTYSDQSISQINFPIIAAEESPYLITLPGVETNVVNSIFGQPISSLLKQESSEIPIPAKEPVNAKKIKRARPKTKKNNQIKQESSESPSKSNKKDKEEVVDKEVQLTISETGIMSVEGSETSSNIVNPIVNQVEFEASALLSKIESGSLSEGNSNDSDEMDTSRRLAHIKEEISTILSTLENNEMYSQSDHVPSIAILETSNMIYTSVQNDSLVEGGKHSDFADHEKFSENNNNNYLSTKTYTQLCPNSIMDIQENFVLVSESGDLRINTSMHMDVHNPLDNHSSDHDIQKGENHSKGHESTGLNEDLKRNIGKSQVQTLVKSTDRHLEKFDSPVHEVLKVAPNSLNLLNSKKVPTSENVENFTFGRNGPLLISGPAKRKSECVEEFISDKDMSNYNVPEATEASKILLPKKMNNSLLPKGDSKVSSQEIVSKDANSLGQNRTPPPSMHVGKDLLSDKFAVSRALSRNLGSKSILVSVTSECSKEKFVTQTMHSSRSSVKTATHPVSKSSAPRDRPSLKPKALEKKTHIRYKTLRTSLKGWNPTIPREKLLNSKMLTKNDATESRFFKARNHALIAKLSASEASSSHVQNISEIVVTAVAPTIASSSSVSMTKGLLTMKSSPVKELERSTMRAKLLKGSANEGPTKRIDEIVNKISKSANSSNVQSTSLCTTFSNTGINDPTRKSISSPSKPSKQKECISIGNKSATKNKKALSFSTKNIESKTENDLHINNGKGVKSEINKPAIDCVAERSNEVSLVSGKDDAEMLKKLGMKISKESSTVSAKTNKNIIKGLIPIYNKTDSIVATESKFVADRIETLIENQSISFKSESKINLGKKSQSIGAKRGMKISADTSLISAKSNEKKIQEVVSSLSKSDDKKSSSPAHMLGDLKGLKSRSLLKNVGFHDHKKSVDSPTNTGFDLKHKQPKDQTPDKFYDVSFESCSNPIESLPVKIKNRKKRSVSPKIEIINSESLMKSTSQSPDQTESPILLEPMKSNFSEKLLINTIATTPTFDTVSKTQAKDMPLKPSQLHSSNTLPPITTSHGNFSYGHSLGYSSSFPSTLNSMDDSLFSVLNDVNQVSSCPAVLNIPTIQDSRAKNMTTLGENSSTQIQNTTSNLVGDIEPNKIGSTKVTPSKGSISLQKMSEYSILDKKPDLPFSKDGVKIDIKQPQSTDLFESSLGSDNFKSKSNILAFENLSDSPNNKSDLMNDATLSTESFPASYQSTSEAIAEIDKLVLQNKLHNIFTSLPMTDSFVSAGDDAGDIFKKDELDNQNIEKILDDAVNSSKVDNADKPCFSGGTAGSTLPVEGDEPISTVIEMACHNNDLIFNNFLPYSNNTTDMGSKSNGSNSVDTEINSCFQHDSNLNLLPYSIESNFNHSSANSILMTSASLTLPSSTITSSLCSFVSSSPVSTLSLRSTVYSTPSSTISISSHSSSANYSTLSLSNEIDSVSSGGQVVSTPNTSNSLAPPSSVSTITSSMSSTTSFSSSFPSSSFAQLQSLPTSSASAPQGQGEFSIAASPFVSSQAVYTSMVTSFTSPTCSTSMPCSANLVNFSSTVSSNLPIYTTVSSNLSALTVSASLVSDKACPTSMVSSILDSSMPSTPKVLKNAKSDLFIPSVASTAAFKNSASTSAVVTSTLTPSTSLSLSDLNSKEIIKSVSSLSSVNQASFLTTFSSSSSSSTLSYENASYPYSTYPGISNFQSNCTNTLTTFSNVTKSSWSSEQSSQSHRLEGQLSTEVSAIRVYPSVSLNSSISSNSLSNEKILAKAGNCQSYPNVTPTISCTSATTSTSKSKLISDSQLSCRNNGLQTNLSSLQSMTLSLNSPVISSQSEVKNKSLNLSTVTSAQSSSNVASSDKSQSKPMDISHSSSNQIGKYTSDELATKCINSLQTNLAHQYALNSLALSAVQNSTNILSSDNRNMLSQFHSIAVPSTMPTLPDSVKHSGVLTPPCTQLNLTGSKNLSAHKSAEVPTKIKSSHSSSTSKATCNTPKPKTHDYNNLTRSASKNESTDTTSVMDFSAYANVSSTLSSYINSMQQSSAAVSLATMTSAKKTQAASINPQGTEALQTYSKSNNLSAIPNVSSQNSSSSSNNYGHSNTPSFNYPSQKDNSCTGYWDAGSMFNPFLSNNASSLPFFSGVGKSPLPASGNFNHGISHNHYRNASANMPSKDQSLNTQAGSNFNASSIDEAACLLKSSLVNLQGGVADASANAKKVSTNVENYNSTGGNKYNANTGSSFYNSNYNSNYMNFLSNTQMQQATSNLSSLVSGAAGYNFPFSNSKFGSGQQNFQQYFNFGQNSFNNYGQATNFNYGTNYQNCMNQHVSTATNSTSCTNTNSSNNFSGYFANFPLPYNANSSFSYNSYPYGFPYQGGDMSSLISPHAAASLLPSSLIPSRSPLPARSGSAQSFNDYPFQSGLFPVSPFMPYQANASRTNSQTPTISPFGGNQLHKVPQPDGVKGSGSKSGCLRQSNPQSSGSNAKSKKTGSSKTKNTLQNTFQTQEKLSASNSFVGGSSQLNALGKAGAK